MKKRKSFLCLIALICAAVFIFSACANGGENDATSGSSSTGGTTESTGTAGTTESGENIAPPEQKSRILIAYFSCTGNTKAVAEKIASLTGGEIYEIVPAEPYTSADINYSDSNCRANREMNDPDARPQIGSAEIDFSEYDTVIIGYPIWWGTMPKIINTFLDKYDLSGKNILPFCTSGGSGITRSVSEIRTAEPAATVRDGLRATGAGDVNLEKWLCDGGAIEIK